MISNKHAVEMVHVTDGRGKSKSKPNVIQDYNHGMSGIEKANQMISYHDCLRKTTRWYKKVALHIIDIYVFNSYTLHRRFSGNKKTQPSGVQRKHREVQIKDKLDFYVQMPQHGGVHYLEQLPSIEKKWPTKELLYHSPS